MKQNYKASQTPELLECGTEFFPALVAAIDAAQTEIFLETYIFSNDKIGNEVASALMNAAKRGVATHLMVDGFGSKEYPKHQIRLMQEAGVEVRHYRPGFFNYRFFRTGARRLHRKLVVIDRRIAFVGGINILDDFEADCLTPRFDFAVIIEGALVDEIHSTMHRLWWLVSWAQLKRRTERSTVKNPAPGTSTPESILQDGIALVLRDNFRNRRRIEQSYLEAIDTAKHRIIIANAYFMPGRKLMRALIRAARRGVVVTLLLQGRVEYFVQHYATQAVYGRLVNAGVRIFQYNAAFLHAKVAVVDDDWATVGSSNLDPISLQLAREANVIVRDAKLTNRLATRLMAATEHEAHEISITAWNNIPMHQRILMRLCHASLRFVHYVVNPKGGTD